MIQPLPCNVADGLGYYHSGSVIGGLNSWVNDDGMIQVYCEGCGADTEYDTLETGSPNYPDEAYLKHTLTCPYVRLKRHGTH